MAEKQKCVWCEAAITERDVIGINRKLSGESTTKFFCLPCFADYIGCTVDDLRAKIKEFKEEGCKLFA